MQNVQEDKIYPSYLITGGLHDPRVMYWEEVLGRDNKVIAHNNVNNASDDSLKYLTAQSKHLICAQLCNEIQTYKKILRLSINLNEKQVQESVDELASSCPIEALATSCNTPMPNITDKLIHSRGYLP